MIVDITYKSPPANLPEERRLSIGKLLIRAGKGTYMLGRSRLPRVENTITFVRCRNLELSTALTSRISPGCTVEDGHSPDGHQVCSKRPLTAWITIDHTGSSHNLRWIPRRFQLTENLPFFQTSCFVSNAYRTGDELYIMSQVCNLNPPMRKALSGISIQAYRVIWHYGPKLWHIMHQTHLPLQITEQATSVESDDILHQWVLCNASFSCISYWKL